MAVTSITLADPASGYSVAIMPATGVAAQSLEVEPSPRTVFESRVGSHGSVDTTQFLDAAVATLQLLLFDPDGTGGPQAAFLDSLGPLLQPALRPTLIVTDSEWATPRQLTVRLDSMSKARSDPTNWPVQIFWVAPNGVWENASQTVYNVPATFPSTTGIHITNTTGMHIPVAGLDMAAATSGGEFSAVNAGALASQWTAQIYGPCTGPKLANDTAGLTLEFTDHLVLQAGQFVQLDSASRSALLNNAPNAPVLTSLNFGTSTWWTLQSGTNQLRYYPSSGSAGSAAVISFRSAWMT